MKSIDQLDDTLETRLDQRKKEIEQAAVIEQEAHKTLLAKTLKEWNCTLLNPENNIEPKVE